MPLMRDGGAIRWIDLGAVDAVASQGVYHALARRMAESSPDTIVVCRPRSPYLCVGYHQNAGAVLDREACRRRGLPLLRRRLGGGATYLDRDQIFYQCVFHHRRLPAVARAAYARVLAAPVGALRSLGLTARLRDGNEIEVLARGEASAGDPVRRAETFRRIAGTGGGRIGEATVIVGNLLFDFDFETMAALWRSPWPSFRGLAAAALRRHLTTLRAELDGKPARSSADLEGRGDVRPATSRPGPSSGTPSYPRVAALLRDRFAAALDRPLSEGRLDPEETEAALDEKERLACPPAGERPGPTPPLKIAGGVFVHAVETGRDGARVRGSLLVRDGTVTEARITAAGRRRRDMERRLLGTRPDDWHRVVANETEMLGDSGPAPTARFAARGDGDRGYSPTARGRTGARRRAAPGRLGDYLEDRFLRRLWTRIREAGPIRSISLDLTERCNLRCAGCYFFAEGMERSVPPDEAEFDAFVERERARGTNLVTVVGGEPSLALERLEKLHRAFRVNVATNGLQPIPRAGFEEMPIGISVWGAPHTDRELRGSGRVDVFRRALANYRDDPRAFWYYTVAPGHARQVAPVVERCVANGNRVLFNFYSDVAGLGGDLDPRRGFADVRRAIDAAIERHPDRILMPSYLSRVVSTGRLRGRRWGHDVCTSVTFDHPANRARVENGRPYSPHFRAYNADLSTRRCCTGIDRSCAACFDTWQHFSWVLLDLRAHLRSRQAFADWLTTTYLFYLTNRLVDFDEGARLLPEIHARGGLDRTAAPAPQRQAPVAAHPRL